MINLWKDPWLLGIPRKIPMLNHGVNVQRWHKVCDLRLKDGSSWNEVLIRRLCNEDSASTIISLEWPRVANNDRLFWCGNKNGIYL